MEYSRKSILQTLAYGDIFDYPLTKEEIWQYLVSSKKIKKLEFERFWTSGENTIASKNKFYHLPKRSEIVGKRIKREKESLIKLKIAQKISSIFSIIPTIYLIGVSGALAMKNSDKNDDIDLFIVTKKNTLWVTRIILLIFLEVLGHRRRRTDKNVADKICLNMLIDEEAVKMPKERQDLYSAHEVSQMLPIFARNNMYRKFINANKNWVKKFLPNVINRGKIKDISQDKRESFLSIIFISMLHLPVINYLAKQLQLWFIKRHQTTESVKDNFLAFHPFEYKNFVLEEYNKRLKKYEI